MSQQKKNPTASSEGRSTPLDSAHARRSAALDVLRSKLERMDAQQLDMFMKLAAKRFKL